MLEMASLGAQVMQARSIFVAKRFRVPIHVRSSFSSKEGTMITDLAKAMEDIVVSGVTVQKDEAKVTMRDVPDKPGMAARLFRELAVAETNVDMIVQNVSREGATDVSFTVLKATCPPPSRSPGRSPNGSAPAPSPRTRGLPRCRSSESGCGATPVWRRKCSRPWPKSASTSR